MATSFRLPQKQLTRLEQLAKLLGTSKAQVVNQAIDKLYEEYMGATAKSAWDVLLEGGFKPVEADLGFNAADEAAQRQVISERVNKKHRR